MAREDAAFEYPFSQDSEENWDEEDALLSEDYYPQPPQNPPPSLFTPLPVAQRLQEVGRIGNNAFVPPLRPGQPYQFHSSIPLQEMPSQQEIMPAPSGYVQGSEGFYEDGNPYVPSFFPYSYHAQEAYSTNGYAPMNADTYVESSADYPFFQEMEQRDWAEQKGIHHPSMPLYEEFRGWEQTQWASEYPTTESFPFPYIQDEPLQAWEEQEFVPSWERFAQSWETGNAPAEAQPEWREVVHAGEDMYPESMNSPVEPPRQVVGKEPFIRDASRSAAKKVKRWLFQAFSVTSSTGEERLSPVKIGVTGLVFLLLVLCFSAIGYIFNSVMENEEDVKRVREIYGVGKGTSSMESVQVQLLPQGQTYPPTATPVPVHTPSPTAVIAMAGQVNNAFMEETEEAQRLRATQYEDNPMNNVLPPFDDLRSENEDIVAKLTIANLVDELVVKRDNTYYLTHNAQSGVSETGAVFVDERYRLQAPPENLLLRGRSNVAGKLLAPLNQYAAGDVQFVKNHAIVRLDTLYEQAEYVLIAVAKVSSNPSELDYIDYWGYTSFVNDSQMENYVTAFRQRSLYEFPVHVQPSDRLLTIATLTDAVEQKSLVLLARRLRSDETAAGLQAALEAISAR